MGKPPTLALILSAGGRWFFIVRGLGAAIAAWLQLQWLKQVCRGGSQGGRRVFM
jgi:hypothetical protein